MVYGPRLAGEVGDSTLDARIKSRNALLTQSLGVYHELCNSRQGVVMNHRDLLGN